MAVILNLTSIFLTTNIYNTYNPNMSCKVILVYDSYRLAW